MRPISIADQTMPEAGLVSPTMKRHSIGLKGATRPLLGKIVCTAARWLSSPWRTAVSDPYSDITFVVAREKVIFAY
jgi:hypothetical protein